MIFKKGQIVRMYSGTQPQKQHIFVVVKDYNEELGISVISAHELFSWDKRVNYKTFHYNPYNGWVYEVLT